MRDWRLIWPACRPSPCGLAIWPDFPQVPPLTKGGDRVMSIRLQTVIGKREISDLLDAYGGATGIGCKAWRRGQELYSCKGTAICRLFHRPDSDTGPCEQYYLYGALQAKKLGHAYISFCPNGLVNWIAPVLQGPTVEWVVAGGPVLLHPVDNLLLRGILTKNPHLGDNFIELRDHLEQVPVVEPARVSHLAEVLWRLATGLMAEEAQKLEQRHQISTLQARVSEIIHRLKKEPGAKPSPALEEQLQQLTLRSKLGDQVGAQQIVAAIAASLPPGQPREAVLTFLLQLAGIALDLGADLELILGLEYLYLCQAVVDTPLKKRQLWLGKILERFVQCTSSLKDVKHRQIIFTAIDYIRTNYNQAISLDGVAAHVGLHPAYFSRLFREETGFTYTDYLNRVRVEAGKRLLTQDLLLADIAQRLGFNDQSYFSKVFKRVEGLPPGKWREAEGKK